MENLELTTEEKKELEKRGFFVKGNYVFSYFLKSTLGIFIFSGLISGVISLIFRFFSSFIGSADTWEPLTLFILNSPYIGIIFGAGSMLYISYYYIYSSHVFYSGADTILGYGVFDSTLAIQRKNINISIFSSGIFTFWNVIKYIFTDPKGGIGFIVIILLIIGCILGLYDIGFIVSEYIGSNSIILFGTDIIFQIGLYFLVFSGIVLLIQILKVIITYPKALYAFGNLGEKIQKLTPQIEEQSQKIQSEFQSDMNFSVLSDRFDSLSSTFSRIIALVLKLEKIEARANKGNLFDSEKYINSLRLDIIEPLQSLREFLENQKTKLLDSQKELTRVRVGGTESTGNIELQSKRSESLITELTENIEKLDAMIGKMGNK